jgi:hypothetical protein
MRRWRRYPQPPAPRQPCDCAALVDQNAVLRARLRVLAGVFEAASAYLACLSAERLEHLEAAVLNAEVHDLAVEVGEGGS